MDEEMDTNSTLAPSSNTEESESEVKTSEPNDNSQADNEVEENMKKSVEGVEMDTNEITQAKDGDNVTEESNSVTIGASDEKDASETMTNEECEPLKSEEFQSKAQNDEEPETAEKVETKESGESLEKEEFEQSKESGIENEDFGGENEKTKEGVESEKMDTSLGDEKVEKDNEISNEDENGKANVVENESSNAGKTEKSNVEETEKSNAEETVKSNTEETEKSHAEENEKINPDEVEKEDLEHIKTNEPEAEKMETSFENVEAKEDVNAKVDTEFEKEEKETSDSDIQPEYDSKIEQNGLKSTKSVATEIVDKDLLALEEVKNSDTQDLKKSNLKLASFADFEGSNCQSEWLNKANSCAQCGHEANQDTSSTNLLWEMMTFCDDHCLKKYQQKNFKECAHCEGYIDTAAMGKYSDFADDCQITLYCTIKCLEEDKKLLIPKCLFCGKTYETEDNLFKVPSKDCCQTKLFCNETCFDKLQGKLGRKIGETLEKACDVCSEVKPVCTRLKTSNESIVEFCSDPCMSAFKYAQTLATTQCFMCKAHFLSQLSSKAGIYQDQARAFCSDQCLYHFRLEKSLLIPCGWCKYSKPDASMIRQSTSNFCSLNCLYMHRLSFQNGVQKLPQKKRVEQRNKGVMKKPHMANKGVTCRPAPCHKAVQTEEPPKPALVPIPVPIYIPMPIQMYHRPYPVPVPVPLPVPVPVFIPTTRNSTRGIKKFMKKIKSKLPTNVFEAQILEMAGAIGSKGEAAEDLLDSDDSIGYDDEEEEAEDQQGEVPLPKPPVPTEDVENVIKGGNIVPKPLPQVTPDACPSPGPHGYRLPNSSPTPRTMLAGIKRRSSEEENVWQAKRMVTHRPRGGNRGVRRQNRAPHLNIETNPALAALTLPPKERPDAKHHLKFTYGVNAWRHWVVGKNAELEKARAQGKYMKPFETDILKLRADELNYTLCMFVKEVRKPNGDNYASDSILYLTLGIQEYLFENGRIDNIFTDMYYEPFTSSLHEVIKDFKLPVNEVGYFVTRIEEEHLWESKQLGAHSPQVLLNTLIYFNAKYFMMKTTDDHSKLAFTHIMKHWKKGGTATPATKHPPVPGEKRTTLLRYYPPAHLKGTRHDDRKCFEQQELPDNPLRCPVKLYEFYLSHCPESAKNKNDLFYLQPERSCVSDSPVWYSTQALQPFHLEKMLARILMVREVQEHMLADAAS